MTTSGTYQWNPPLYDLVINAYGRIGTRRAALTIDHWADAAMCSNLLQSEWANRQVNLWTVDLQTIPLVQGTATYTVDPTTVEILSCYLALDGVDRLMISIDRDTYASYPDKTQQDAPTVFWFQKKLAPEITVWPVPDGNGPYDLKFYRARQIQDAVIPGGVNPEVPFVFLEAYVAGLAAKLSQLYARQNFGELMQAYSMAWKEAANRNVENAPWRIIPALASYNQGVY